MATRDLRVPRICAPADLFVVHRFSRAEVGGGERVLVSSVAGISAAFATAEAFVAGQCFDDRSAHVWFGTHLVLYLDREWLGRPVVPAAPEAPGRYAWDDQAEAWRSE